MLRMRAQALVLSLSLPLMSAASAADPQVAGDWAVDAPRSQAQTGNSVPSAVSGDASSNPSVSGGEPKIDIPMVEPVTKDGSLTTPIAVPVTPVLPEKTPEAEKPRVPEKPVEPAKTLVPEKPVVEKGTVETQVKSATAPAAAQPVKLYGRIEQITASNGANFPIVLKAMTPSLDTSLQQKNLKAGASDTSLYSGTVAKSFPQDFRGTWGGNLTVWRIEQAPICWKIDPEEASKIQRIMKSGSTGAVNFMFANDAKGGITLAPAKILFQVPGRDVDMGKQMAQMMGGNMAAMGPMGQMMEQMAQNMPVPIMFYFGEFRAGTDTNERALSGNAVQQYVIRNTVRQLSQGVIEQQLITQTNEIMRATGQPRKRYTESVLRFTRTSAGQMYVQAAQVTYGGDKKFQEKIVMYGNVAQGRPVNTNPYSGMMQMMPQGSTIQMGPGQNPFGQGGFPFGGGAGNGQMPQLPPGFNPFQGLFGQ